MTKNTRSGYSITIKAFLPCDVHVRGNIAAADSTMDGLQTFLGINGFIAVDTKITYRHRAEIARNPEAADDVFREVAEPVAERVAAGVADNSDPGMPDKLRRGTKAGG